MITIRTTIRLIARLFTEFLCQKVVSIGLLILHGSAYTQVMIGLTSGVVLLLMGILMAKVL